MTLFFQKLVQFYNLFILLLKLMIGSLQHLILMVINFDLKFFKLLSKIPILRFLLLSMNLETFELCLKSFMLIVLTLQLNNGCSMQTIFLCELKKIMIIIFIYIIMNLNLSILLQILFYQILVYGFVQQVMFYCKIH